MPPGVRQHSSDRRCKLQPTIISFSFPFLPKLPQPAGFQPHVRARAPQRAVLRHLLVWGSCPQAVLPACLPACRPAHRRPAAGGERSSQRQCPALGIPATRQEEEKPPSRWMTAVPSGGAREERRLGVPKQAPRATGRAGGTLSLPGPLPRPGPAACHGASPRRPHAPFAQRPDPHGHLDVGHGSPHAPPPAPRPRIAPPAPRHGAEPPGPASPRLAPGAGPARSEAWARCPHAALPGFGDQSGGES